MKVELILITANMSQEEQTKAMNENFESLNQHQHEREMAIFSRFNELSNRVEGVKILVDYVHREMIQSFDKTNNQIGGLDSKINQVQAKLSKKIDLVDSKLDKILENLNDKKLLTEED